MRLNFILVYVKIPYSYYRYLAKYSDDMIMKTSYLRLKSFKQHGIISVYHHSIAVALLSLYIARYFQLKIDNKSLIRGALLHDYFLYDWHLKDKSHKWHGFIHASRALENANNEYDLNLIERDIIKKHMFPLNIAFPKYKESLIVCIADKIIALYETVFKRN